MSDSFDLQVPKFENPFETDGSLTDLEKGLSKQLRNDGYCVLDFPDINFGTLADGLVSKLSSCFIGENSNKQLSPGQRLQDALDIEEVRQIAGNGNIINILTNIYGRKAFPFQTLNFPSGTQQDAHSDHVHFDSIPHRFMAGVWLALEDIDEENGPLFYYPGSHNWRALYNTEVGHHQTDETASHYNRFPESWEAYAKFFGVEKQYFYAKKGQCLIWSSNLVHGGAKHINKSRTRWSQVTHYYFDDCAYYTPLLSSPHTGSYQWREISNLISKEHKPNRVNGFDVSIQSVSNLRKDISFDPDRYLKLNPDVKATGVNPYQHYLEYGIKEGRLIE